MLLPRLLVVSTSEHCAQGWARLPAVFVVAPQDSLVELSSVRSAPQSWAVCLACSLKPRQVVDLKAVPTAQLGEAEAEKGPVELFPAERRAKEGEAGYAQQGG